jgi:hypothetical protein
MQLQWDPYADQPIADISLLENFDAAIHLSGEDVAAGRWTDDRKLTLRNSRILPLQALERIFSSLTLRPTVLLTASAIGIYGNRGDTPLGHYSDIGTGFLPTLCQEWETAALAIAPLGIRVVPMRFGAVLASNGGMLKKILPIFRAGFGGRLGPGTQWLSWIALDDACRIAQFILDTPAISGPINVCSPHPVTNTVFTGALARALQRPAFLPVPVFALRLAYGQMADDMLLASTRAIPASLNEFGYRFLYPDLEAALSAALH